MKITGKIAENDLIALEEKGRTLHHKAPRIWVVLADTRIAKIFRKTIKGVELIGEALPTVTQRKKGVPDDSMGRVISFGGPRHKLEPGLQPGRRDAVHFAHDLSLWLDEAVRKDFFDRLVLIAAPRTLGDIRKHLSKPVQGRITAEISKELTKLDEKTLQEELKEIVWF